MSFYSFLFLLLFTFQLPLRKKEKGIERGRKLLEKNIFQQWFGSMCSLWFLQDFHRLLLTKKRKRIKLLSCIFMEKKSIGKDFYAAKGKRVGEKREREREIISLHRELWKTVFLSLFSSSGSQELRSWFKVLSRSHLLEFLCFILRTVMQMRSRNILQSNWTRCDGWNCSIFIFKTLRFLSTLTHILLVHRKSLWYRFY